MDINGIMGKIAAILDDAKTGVFATVDNSGKPHMRWMTPTLLQGRPGTIFAVTSPQLAKAVHLASQPEAEWMLQTRALNEIVNIKCRINIIDNPSIKAEILEAIGNKLTVFWKVNNNTDIIILETVIKEATYFCPVKGIREIVYFDNQEDE